MGAFLCAVLVAAVLAPLGAVHPAVAATVYELEGEWAAGTPAQVGSGDPLSSVWRFNLNDDGPAPGNSPVENVTIVFTAQNARFSELPPMCSTTGSPASGVSDDRATLTCNVGTRPEGTAEITLADLVAYGPAGSAVSVSAQVADQTEALPPIPIIGDFAMDLRIDGGTPLATFADGERRVVLPWSLRHAVGSEQGPASVSYDIDVTFGDAALVASLPTSGGVAVDGCVPQGRAQSGYPFSGAGHPASRTAAFPECELEVIATNKLRLTLSVLDYAGAVPASDSVGTALPTEWDVIAAGEFLFQFAAPASGTTGISVEASAPTYTSTPSGLTFPDDPANNTNSTSVYSGNWFGGWTLDWQIPPGIGTPWADTSRSMAGELVLATSAAEPGVNGNLVLCSVLDSRYVMLESSTLGRLPDDSNTPTPFPGVGYEYYVGDGPGGTMDPDDPAYDPNAFRCADPDAGWTTTLPGDLSQVRAVRATSSQATIDAMGDLTMLVLFTWVRIRHDTPDDQDIWFWTSFSSDSAATWVEDHRGSVYDPAWLGSATETPDARYAFAFSGRDVLRTVPVTPVIQKTVDQEIAAPGAVVDYTITAIPEAPLDAVNALMTVVDTLPAGVAYVPGSASPEPVVLGSRLTWTFADGATNEPVVILFSATLPSSAAPGDLITNTATVSIGDLTRTADASTRVQAGGFTSVRKSVAAGVVPQTDGVADNTWTIRLESRDSASQAFTDTIDVLPYAGDGRGTSFTGSYALTGAIDVSGMPAGATVYYTTAAAGTISEDPADASNGAAGDASGSTIWSTTFDADATAVRVIGPALPSSAVHTFTVSVTTTGASPGDRYVNRAQARAGHTALIMRTSSSFTIEPLDDPGPAQTGLGRTGAEVGPTPVVAAMLLIAGVALTVLGRPRRISWR